MKVINYSLVFSSIFYLIFGAVMSYSLVNSPHGDIFHNFKSHWVYLLMFFFAFGVMFTISVQGFPVCILIEKSLPMYINS